MQTQVGVGDVTWCLVEIDDGAHHLGVHVADGVTTGFGDPVQVVRDFGFIGGAQFGLGVPGVQDIAVLMDGGQSPTPGLTVGRGGL